MNTPHMGSVWIVNQYRQYQLLFMSGTQEWVHWVRIQNMKSFVNTVNIQGLKMENTESYTFRSRCQKYTWLSLLQDNSSAIEVMVLLIRKYPLPLSLSFSLSRSLSLSWSTENLRLLKATYYIVAELLNTSMMDEHYPYILQNVSYQVWTISGPFCHF